MEYEIAQICLKGHVIHKNILSIKEIKDKYCERCGSVLIHECQSCHMPIRGEEKISPWVGGLSNRYYHIPAYCYNCGNPYPWTRDIIDNTNAFIDENMPELSQEERSDLKARIPDITFESSKLPLSASRIAKYLAKVSSLAKEGFKNNIFGITLELAKRYIWPA